MIRDIVDVSAKAPCYIAWRCVACDKVQCNAVDYGVEETFVHADEDTVAVQRRDYFARRIARWEAGVNAGSFGPLPIDGRCVSCGERQPWSKLPQEVREEQVTVSRIERKKGEMPNGLVLPLVVVIMGSVMVGTIVGETAKGVAGLVALAAMVVAGIFAIRHYVSRSRIERTTDFPGTQIRQMTREGRANCLPLAACSRETLAGLPQDDPRVRLLNEKVPAGLKLEPRMTPQGYDSLVKC